MGVFKPYKLLILSFLIWFLFYTQTDVTYIYSGSLLFPMITLLGYILAFLTGTHSLKTSHIKFLPKTSAKKIKQITIVFFLIGLMGVILKIYSGVFNSGIFLAEDVFEKRLENMGQEFTGGAMGIIGSILFPFSVIAMLIGIYNYKLFGKLSLFCIVLVGLYPFVETVFLGGRTIIALLGTTLVFIVYASFFKNTNVHFTKLIYQKKAIFSFPSILKRKRVLIPTVLVGFFFVLYSVNIVNKRLERFNYGNRTLKVWEQKDYQWVKFDEDFKNDFYNSTKEEKSKMLGYHSLKHYFSHGVFEYIRLINYLDKSTGYYYGMYEFNVFFKFFKFFGVPLKSFEELNSIVKRQAVYKTFFGPFYIDFGVFGLFVLFFWGRFVKRIYVYASRGETQYLIFYGYISTIIITCAFINFLQGASSYYLFAFLITLLVFKLWPNNLKIVNEKI